MYMENLAWLQCSTGEPQLLQYFKMVFIKIQNVLIRTDFVNPFTYVDIFYDICILAIIINICTRIYFIS